MPVLSLVTETDLIDGRLSGYAGSRVKDHKTLRVWEVAGAAHADGYLFNGAFTDDGKRSAAEMAHHYVLQGALTALDGWVRSGKAPASTKPIETVLTGDKTTFALDNRGNAKGGVRTPWTDVPTMRLSGLGNNGGFVGMLVGVGEAFDAEKLGALYPGGKAEYLSRFTRALDAAIGKGHILKEDRQEILDIAAINYHGAR